MRHRLWLSVPSALTVALAACGDEPAPALTVGPASFTENQLLGLSEERKEMLAELTALGLAVADSSVAELGGSLVADSVDNRLMEILAAELTLEKHGIGDDVLEARYLSEPEWELTVRHILVFSERWRSAAHREAAQAKAGRALAMLQAGTPFEEVETALASEGGAQVREGLMPPGREGTWVPEFWEAALALQSGELSPVTETQYGYHVLRLEDRRIVPFEEARSAVARRVAAEIDEPMAVLATWASSMASSLASREGAAIAEAHKRGLEVPDAERAEIVRQWEDRVGGWATVLGFTYGLGPDDVAAAAFAALARPGQSADIARREVAQYRALLRARYPVSFGTASTAQS